MNQVVSMGDHIARAMLAPPDFMINFSFTFTLARPASLPPGIVGAAQLSVSIELVSCTRILVRTTG